MQLLVIAIGFLMVAAPLANPRASVILAGLLWPPVYGAVWLLSGGFHPVQSLPWYITDTERTTTSLIIIIGALGLLKGIFNCLAMLSVWVPLLVLPFWLQNLGVAAEHKAGWTCYVLDNYNDFCSDRNGGYVCQYAPLDGKPPPSFAKDDRNGIRRILAVHAFPLESSMNASP